MLTATKTLHRETRLFLSGTLKGMTWTRDTESPHKLGFECLKPIGNAAYRIVAVEPIYQERVA